MEGKSDMADDIITAADMAVISNDLETVRRNVRRRDVDWAWGQCKAAASRGAFEVSLICGSNRDRYLNVLNDLATDGSGIIVVESSDEGCYPENEEEYEEELSERSVFDVPAYTLRLSWKDAAEGTRAHALRENACKVREASRTEVEYVIGECMKAARYGGRAAYPVIHDQATKEWLRELGYKVSKCDDEGLGICEVLW